MVIKGSNPIMSGHETPTYTHTHSTINVFVWTPDSVYDGSIVTLHTIVLNKVQQL